MTIRWDQLVLADEPDARGAGQLRYAMDTRGVEDPRPGRQDDACSLQRLHEQLGHLIGEQLRIGGGGFNHESPYVTPEMDFGETVSPERRKGPHTRCDPINDTHQLGSGLMAS